MRHLTPQLCVKATAITILVGMTSLAEAAAAAGGKVSCTGCFAMVRANGTLVNSRGVVSVSTPIMGEYIITFKFPINRCAITSSIDTLENNGLNVTFSLSPLITRAVGSNTKIVVNIAAPDVSGLVAKPFSLVVTC